MKQDNTQSVKDFGSFRIAENGRVLVRDLALLQAIREEMNQEVVSEKVALDVIHVASMPQHNTSTYTTLV
jgi:hypothetical protein